MIENPTSNHDIPEEPASDEDTSENPLNMIADAAIDAGIDVELPNPGTEAYSRLYKLARDYSDEVQREMAARAFPDSQSVRRALHSDLCVMLFGHPWQDVSSEQQKQARNFAHLLRGRNQLVD